jgi:hypothetical protein
VETTFAIKQENEQTASTLNELTFNANMPTSALPIESAIAPSTLDTDSSTQRPSIQSFIKEKFKGESLYIKCEPDENMCQNGGTCLKSNPKHPRFSLMFEMNFCICPKFHEGRYCEFEMIQSIKYNPDEIPSTY